MKAISLGAALVALLLPAPTRAQEASVSPPKHSPQCAAIILSPDAKLYAGFTVSQPGEGTEVVKQQFTVHVPVTKSVDGKSVVEYVPETRERTVVRQKVVMVEMVAELEHGRFQTAAGKELTVEQVKARLKPEVAAPLLIFEHDQQIVPAYFRAILKDDVLIFTGPLTGHVTRKSPPK